MQLFCYAVYIIYRLTGLFVRDQAVKSTREKRGGLVRAMLMRLGDVFDFAVSDDVSDIPELPNRRVRSDSSIRLSDTANLEYFPNFPIKTGPVRNSV